MTDEQVTRVLAPRIKLSIVDWPGLGLCTRGPDHLLPIGPEHPLLPSTDALRPVLAGLSPDDRNAFLYRVLGNAEGANWASFEQIVYLLKLPPRTLAHALAEVLSKEGKL